MLYILYRKINIGDGEHEAADRIVATATYASIFKIDKYTQLKKYEEEWSDCESVSFTYFVLPITLDDFNLTGVDDSQFLFDPSQYAPLMKFCGNLKEFKKLCI